MKKNVWFVMAVLGVCVMSVNAATVAYWRFEEGPAGAQVPKTVMGGTWEPSTADSSGNGYHLSVWDQSGAGYRYRSDVAGPVVNSAANNFSVKNSGGWPAMWTQTGAGIQTMTPAAFTIEATFKLENGGWRTLIGRDSYGAATKGNDTNPALSALYFQATPGNRLAIKFVDVDGYWHDATSAENVFQSFHFPSNPDGVGVPWYSMAAVSDGTLLSLYLRNVTAEGAWALIAQTDMTVINPGSTNTALSAGMGAGGDWDAGNFSVGRGMYNGGHADRAWGYLDEIRISDSALAVSEFLLVVPEPATLALLALGTLVLRRKR